jgi:hypothetical protein
MRSHVPLVPAFDDQVFPHQAYPPWQSLMRVVRLLADALGRRPPTATLRPVEVRLFQAARHIVDLARGGLTYAGWHRRLTGAVARIEQARLAVTEGALAPAEHALTSDEARALVAAIDDTLARLAEALVHVPIPDDLGAAS